MRTVRPRPGWLRRLAIVVAVCSATMTAAVVLAEDCKLFTLDVPDTETLRLADGEHVVASTRTDKGPLEAKVVVRAGKASAAQYYIGGKLMRPTPEQRVPGDIRSCLGLEKRGGMATPLHLLGDASRSVRDFFEPPLEAFRCRVSCHCNQNTCCCLAKCGEARGVDCVGF